MDANTRKPRPASSFEDPVSDVIGRFLEEVVATAAMALEGTL
jgi:hypothetical protein